MYFDIAIVFLLIFFSIVGYIRGAWSQVIKLGALVVAFYLSGPLASPFYNFIYEIIPSSPTVKYYIARTLAGVCIYVGCSIIGKFVEGLLFIIDRIIEKVIFGREGSFREWNRLFGLLLGFLKTAIILALLIWVLDIVPVEAKLQKFPELIKDAKEMASESIIIGLVSQFNPLEKIVFINRINRLQYLSQDPERMDQIEATGEYKRLDSNPRFRELIQDKALIDAIGKSDYEALLGNQKFLTIIKDQQLIDQVRALNLDKIE